MRKLVLLIIFIVFISCEKDKVQSIDCDNFYVGVTTLNENMVKAEIEKLTVDLEPTITTEDAIGHIGNIQILVERLNNNCDNYTAKKGCYACIFTFPAQSELLIEFISGGRYIIDLHTPENDILRFAGVHEQ